jgi:hypothetical protein
MRKKLYAQPKTMSERDDASVVNMQQVSCISGKANPVNCLKRSEKREQTREGSIER